TKRISSFTLQDAPSRAHCFSESGLHRCAIFVCRLAANLLNAPFALGPEIDRPLLRSRLLEEILQPARAVMCVDLLVGPVEIHVVAGDSIAFLAEDPHALTLGMD